MSRPTRRRELIGALPLALREVLARLMGLNQSIGGPLSLNTVELLCLDLVGRHGPITPGHLAEMCGIRPATITGILDRLEDDGWVQRERDAQDRRRVFVQARLERAPELLGRYGGMTRALREISSDYSDAELAVLLDFLTKVSEAGKNEAAVLQSEDD